MRKVTEKTVKAFLDGKSASIGNTVSTGSELILHGNTIARRRADGVIEATLAGWPTVTTRERLNGLCRSLGLNRSFYQSKRAQYFGDSPISSVEWIVLC